MDDLVSRITRELPDTDRDRYDIAYQRGRAQARSSLLLGGLALGAAAGSLLTFLLDPVRGRARRIELGQRLGAFGRRTARTVQGRTTDVRNRAFGAATELGLPGTPASHADEREKQAGERGTMGLGGEGANAVVAPESSMSPAFPTPRSAGAHAGTLDRTADEALVGVGGSSDR